MLTVLADDLTGALDGTVAFRRHCEVLVLPSFESPGGPDVALEQRLTAAAALADVVGVDTGSRGVDASTAAARVARVAAWAQSHPGGTSILKKVDSALRGQIKAELTALTTAGPGSSSGPPLLLCPALPEQGRTTVHGLHHDARPGAGSATTTDLRTLVPVGYRPVPVDATALRGEDLRGCLAAIDPGEAGLVDAVTAGDLAALAGALPASDGLLVAASSGLLRAVAHRTAPLRSGADEVARPRLVVTASRHAATRRQLALMALQPGYRLVELDVDDVLSGWTEAGAASAAAAAAPTGSDEVVLLTLPLVPLRHGAPRDGAVLVDALADVVAGTDPAAGLLLVGGDVAAAVCRRLGSTLLAPVGEPAPGTVVCRVLGGDSGAARPLLTVRSGGFGSDDSLLILLGARPPFLSGGHLV